MADPTFNPSADVRPLDASKTWVLLWSQQQGMLHIETLAEMLAKNAKCFRNAIACQYIPLVIGSEDMVERTAESIRPIVAQRFDAASSGNPHALPYAALP
ncbi:hypothetical protein [Paracidovorax anthurii]|uniref:Uncharacterized protein n=1 Tax=Paracidovorax anthurii TaxID=78229 RepID=A0A328ZGN9_9BURK|nr:hypothetical protein [Paracidovorax anthurii]RAR85019.1 hypothetical protein AX018_1008112 [Paracidovorax anthurii]